MHNESETDMVMMIEMDSSSFVYLELMALFLEFAFCDEMLMILRFYINLSFCRYFILWL